MKTPSHHQLDFKFNNHFELSPFSHLKHRFFGVTSLQLMRQSLTTRQCTVISFKHGQLHICHTGTKQLSSSFYLTYGQTSELSSFYFRADSYLSSRYKTTFFFFLSYIRTDIRTLFFHQDSGGALAGGLEGQVWIIDEVSLIGDRGEPRHIHLLFKPRGNTVLWDFHYFI